MNDFSKQCVSITCSFNSVTAKYYDVVDDGLDRKEVLAFAKSHLHEFLPHMDLVVTVHFMDDEPVVYEATLSPVKYCTRAIKNIKKELG